MSKYGKKKLTSLEARIQNLKEYQKEFYHNANASFGFDISVKGKSPNGKYDIDLCEMRECFMDDFAHYMPIEDHGGKYYDGGEYYVSVQWFPSDTKHLFEEHVSDPTMKSLMFKLGWCDQNGNPTDVVYNLNKNGHRCKNLDGDIGKGILFLGCSHTFGVGLNQQDTFAYKVAEHFGRECFNYGLPGKGLDTAATYTSLFLEDDVDLNLIDAVVVYATPPGRVGFFNYYTKKDGDSYIAEMQYSGMQNDELLMTNYYQGGYLNNLPQDHIVEMAEMFDLHNGLTFLDVQKKLDSGLQPHIDNFRSNMWEHYMFTKENNFIRDLHSINSIKCFCLENNIPLIVQEGSPTIATKDDWARDMRHFGKQTHTNISKDIISKLGIYLDK
tara:strand:+ start:5 stop:1156 length:1152 start_codon:yes stop_codon:yes gene_type:complete